jgi:hypothetical protein
MTDLKELKQEADELGVTYAKNISAEKLAEKIDAFYTSKEDSAVTITEPEYKEELDDVQEESKDPRKDKPLNKEQLKLEKRRTREAGAKKTRIILIVDNDQRVNNHTTTCTVNCSNEYFDLGTRILPLNEKIEVAIGHIDTLKGVQIPLHITDSKTGMSTVRMRPRYTISYEDNKNN